METTTSGGTDNSMEAFLEERAQQLFLLSDQERKGFIVKRDMQRMRSEIPLTPEQLEAVFDSLDVNNNGYLTIEQFLSGFGEFIASQSDSSWEDDNVMEPSQKDVQENDEPVHYLLHEVESINILNNVEVLRQLCQHVEREANPNVQNNLEIFLQQLVVDLKRCKEEQRNLIDALKSKDEEHEAQVRRLFEEMEAQLHEEKKNRTRQEEHMLRLRRNTLENDLVEKEQQLQDALNRQQELTERVQVLRSREINVKEENERLLKAKEEVEVQLEAEHREVVQLQRFLDDVRQNEAWERRKHQSMGFRLAKRIMLEQQGLMHQLQLLQQMKSTLEGGEEEQTTGSKSFVDRSCKDTNGDETNSLPVRSPSIKPWKRHLPHVESEDDFFGGAEFLAYQKYEEDEDSYRHISTTVKS